MVTEPFFIFKTNYETICFVRPSYKTKRPRFIQGKRATEYADIPSEFNDVESAGFFVLMTCFAVAYLPYYRKWVNTVSAIVI